MGNASVKYWNLGELADTRSVRENRASVRIFVSSREKSVRKRWKGSGFHRERGLAQGEVVLRQEKSGRSQKRCVAKQGAGVGRMTLNRCRRWRWRNGGGGLWCVAVLAGMRRGRRSAASVGRRGNPIRGCVKCPESRNAMPATPDSRLRQGPAVRTPQECPPLVRDGTQRGSPPRRRPR